MNKYPANFTSVCLLVVLFLAGEVPATAQLITFETAPDGATPVDDSLLSTPYNITGGTVRFFYDLNGNNHFDSGTDALPAFEVAGNDAVNAFSSAWDSSADTARPGYSAQLGNYFLRTAGVGPTGDLPPEPPGPFIAQCITAGTITAFSGELWDIDGNSGGTEQWRVEVLDSSNNVLASELSPVGTDQNANSLDSLPWVFSFDNLPSNAESVRLTFIGTKEHGAGFAFNNFSVTVVPEPSTLMLLALGSLGLLRWKFASWKQGYHQIAFPF